LSFEYTDPLLEKLLTDKEQARRDYELNPQKGRAGYEPDTAPLLRDWLALVVTFNLQAPWFSRDDIPFHVLDNPVHRDHVFGAPFMSASSWKGLLRWACRMRTGLLAHLEASGNELRDWRDDARVVHLFGNERDEATDFRRGALTFRPTWFDKIGFEVINPHDRTKKAGKNPILYEVVPPGTQGKLCLLYAPSPGQAARDGVSATAAVTLLLEAVDDLVVKYGFSAKRTSGWGVASIPKVRAEARGVSPVEVKTLHDLQATVTKWLGDSKP